MGGGKGGGGSIPCPPPPPLLLLLFARAGRGPLYSYGLRSNGSGRGGLCCGTNGGGPCPTGGARGPGGAYALLIMGLCGPAEPA